MPLITILVILILILLLIWVLAKLQTARRVDYINSFSLPQGIFEKLQKRRPELTIKDCQLVNKGLRQFFLAYLKSGRKYVSMPSQAADDLWHEFILYTRQYDGFCKRAFGGFLHHTPAVVLKSNRQNNTGLRRCWWYACKEELINPRKPVRLPLLFALDAKLNIKDGFRYVADCSLVRSHATASDDSRVIYCGGDFSDASIDGGLDGFDSGFGSGSSESDGSGCSGGCSGGCGGGN
jgi:hypothetical protein